MRKEVDKKGTIYYYNESDQYHRSDGPAVEYWYGEKFWYQNGRLHRLDGPAIERCGGRVGYYLEGKQYTEDEYQLILFTQYGKIHIK